MISEAAVGIGFYGMNGSSSLSSMLPEPLLRVGVGVSQQRKIIIRILNIKRSVIMIRIHLINFRGKEKY